MAFHYAAMIKVIHIVFTKELVKNHPLQRLSFEHFNFENHGYGLGIGSFDFLRTKKGDGPKNLFLILAQTQILHVVVVA